MWLHHKEGENSLHFDNQTLKWYLNRLRYQKIKYFTKHLVNFVQVLENFYVSSDFGIDLVWVRIKRCHTENKMSLGKASHMLQLEGFWAKKNSKNCSKSRKHGKWDFIQKLFKVPLSRIRNSLNKKFYAIKWSFLLACISL